MKELKRILLSPLWLGVLVFLVLCHTGLFVYEEISFAGGSLSTYAKETRRLQDALSKVSSSDGLLLLDEEKVSAEGWQAAYAYVSDSIDESFVDLLRESYPDFDEMVNEIRGGKQIEHIESVIQAISQWQRRLTYQEGYAQRIEEVVQQAKRIRSNPVFAQPDSFAYRNAAMTEEDYASIADVSMTLVSDDIINAYVEDSTALIFGLCLMAVTVVLLLEPRRLKMEMVERSTINGRTILTMYRIIAIVLAGLVTTIALHGSALFSAMFAYGEGIDLSLPVQNMEFFGSWTMETTVGGFLLWHLFFRWFGLVLAGMLFWLVLSRIRSLPLGLVTCSAILLLEYHWFTSYGIHDAGYYLASINLFHLLSSEDIAGRYMNYNIFGYPVHERTVLTALLIIFVIGMSIGMVLSSYFYKGVHASGRLSRVLSRIGVLLRSRRKPRSVFVYECRKVLVYGGSGIVLFAVSLFLVTRGAPISYQSKEEAMLSSFVKLYAGEVTEENLEEISSLRLEADEAYANASIDNRDMEYLATRSYALQALEERYTNLLEKKNAGEKGIMLVDEQPLERMFGESGEILRLSEACAVLLGLCVAIPGLFSKENNNGMTVPLHSTLYGRTVLWENKVLIALGMGVLLYLVWTVHDLFLLQDIGIRWQSLLAGGNCLDYWQGAPGALPLWSYLLFFYILRLVGVLSAASCMVYISARFPILLRAGGIGVTVLLLPALLSLAGAGWLGEMSYAIALGGVGLAITWKTFVWLFVWIVCGVVSMAASKYEWRRHDA